MKARWIDLGALPPRELHAAYSGLAECQAADAPPIACWVRAEGAHLSLGPSQSAALAIDAAACAAAGVEVVRRPLGGGTVLVDGRQRICLLIAPRAAMPLAPAEFIRRCLRPVAETYRHYGIRAEVRGGTDVWFAGAKIAGAGAATLGTSLVFGSSFIEGFDRELFCRLVRAPSEGFRAWLRDELERGLREWPRSPGFPPEPELVGVWRAELARCLGWGCEPDRPRAFEHEAMARALEELEADDGDGVVTAARVRHGIKINAETFLTEADGAGGWLRVLTRGGAVARVGAADPTVSGALQTCVGSPPRCDALRGRLRRGLGAAAADHWSERVAQTAHVEPCP